MATEFKTATCKGCGKKCIWAAGPNGERLLLDAVAPCYRASISPITDEVLGERQRDVFVLHFATCPKASQFSGRSKDK